MMEDEIKDESVKKKFIIVYDDAAQGAAGGDWDDTSAIINIRDLEAPEDLNVEDFTECAFQVDLPEREAEELKPEEP